MSQEQDGALRAVSRRCVGARNRALSFSRDSLFSNSVRAARDSSFCA